MKTNYQVRWISRRRVKELTQSGRLAEGLTLDHLNGTLIIEPVGSDLGDGPVVSEQEADYEMQPAWILDSKAMLRRARGQLGLPMEEAVGSGV